MQVMGCVVQVPDRATEVDMLWVPNGPGKQILEWMRAQLEAGHSADVPAILAAPELLKKWDGKHDALQTWVLDLVARDITLRSWTRYLSDLYHRGVEVYLKRAANKGAVETIRNVLHSYDNLSFSDGAFTLASDIEERKVEWLWAGRIPLGAVTILTGKRGEGKSVLTCDLASTVSRGRALPGHPDDPDARDVLIVSVEDDPESVIVPRLRAAGGDLTRIHVFRWDQHLIQLPDRLEPLRRHALKAKPGLIILDPVQAMAGGKLDPNNAVAVRALLNPLSILAVNLGCAIVCVAHPSRSGGSSVAGSGAWEAAARSILVLGKDDSDVKENRVLTQDKSSWAASVPTVTLRVEKAYPDPTVPHIVWGRELEASEETSATAVLSQREDDSQSRSERKRAGDWLREVLACEGGEEKNALQKMAKAEELSWATVRRAYGDIGCVSRTVSHTPAGKPINHWQLPGATPSVDQPPAAKNAPGAVTYALGAGDFEEVKIGQSQGPDTRCQAMSSERNVKLSILCVLDISEAQVHADLATYRLHGEWFKACPEVYEYLSVQGIEYEMARGAQTANSGEWDLAGLSKGLSVLRLGSHG